MKLKRYIIIQHDGTPKSERLFKQYARACFWAKDEGDSVVAVEVDLGQEPLFIRKVG